jgi:hypothetical protein
MSGFNSNIHAEFESQNDDLFEGKAHPPEVSKTKSNNVIDGDFEREKD